MRTEWRSIGIPPEASLREAMAAVDRGQFGIALVVDADGCLLGTVTDGDLRRALLRGVALDARADQVMNRAFVAVRQEVTDSDVLELMRAHSVRQIPVLDAEGRMAGLYFLPDLAEPSTRANWAVIMAGGEGRRLRPLTAETPKPMLPVRDRPLLENTVALLVKHGFRTLFISVGYRAEQIEKHFEDGQRFGCRIAYLREERPLGTGGALSLLPERPSAPLVVLNGDLLTDLDLSALMDYHAKAGCAATQCVREYVFQVPFGVVRCEEGHVIETEEKPLQRLLINAGIYVISPQLLSLVPANQGLTMPDLLGLARHEGFDVAAFPIREQWIDIGRPDDYEWVCNNWTTEKDE